MSAAEIVLAIAAVAGGAIVQGSVGVGLSLVAAPALVAIDPSFIPGPLLIVGQIVGIRHIIVEGRHIDWQALRHALWGLPVGIAAGLAVVEFVPLRILALIVGILTAVSAAVLLGGFRLPQTRKTEIAGGLTCSFGGLAASLPGAPLAICFSEMRPPALRSTSSLFIGIVGVVGIALLAARDRFGLHELTLIGYMAPGMFIGLGVSRLTRPLLDRTWFRPAVLSVALAGGLALIIGQLA
ncbi:MAG: sulfite exporter TauE/SafE family protein [bacterium]|nr:sulfite exporter TauE/SafE family protein [bacterium]MDE0669535.1 sulfite exporter TauE/SafE family protein [bacterium]